MGKGAALRSGLRESSSCRNLVVYYALEQQLLMEVVLSHQGPLGNIWRLVVTTWGRSPADI